MPWADIATTSIDPNNATASAQALGFQRLGSREGGVEVWRGPDGLFYEYNPTSRQYRNVQPPTGSELNQWRRANNQPQIAGAPQAPAPQTSAPQTPAPQTQSAWSSLQGTSIDPNNPYASAAAAGFQRVGANGSNEVWRGPDGLYYEYNPTTRQYRATTAPATQPAPVQPPPTQQGPPPGTVGTNPVGQPVVAQPPPAATEPPPTASGPPPGTAGTNELPVSAGQSVLSAAGGIDPNFVANQAGQAALAVGNMPNQLGQYLNSVNPNQFASWLNTFINQANPGAAASNLNNFIGGLNDWDVQNSFVQPGLQGVQQTLGDINNFGQEFKNWDVQNNFVQPGLQGFQDTLGQLGDFRQSVNAWTPPGLDQMQAMGSSTPDAIARANQMLSQYSSSAPPTLQQSADLLRQYATFAPQVGSTPEGQAALNQMSGLVQQGISPFLTGDVGDVGSSPTMKAAVDAWRQNVMPIVQQQMQLAGLGRSAATAGAAGESLTSAMVPLIQQEYQNRLQAAGLGTGLYGALSETQQWQGQQNLGARESQIGAANMLGQAGLGLNQQQIGAAQALSQSGLGLNQQQIQALQSALQGGIGAEQLRQSGLLGAAGQQAGIYQNLLQGGATAEQLRQAGIMGATGQQLGGYQNLLQSGGTAEQLRQAGILGGTGLQYQGSNNAANLQSQGMLGAAGLLGNLGQFGVSSLQQGLGLEQQAGVNAANIANQERSRQLQAALGAGNLMLGLSNPLLGAAQNVQTQQQNYLQGGAQAGQLQRDITQQGYTSEMMDYLRRQALGESSTSGLFGGAVLPKTLNTAASTSK